MSNIRDIYRETDEFAPVATVGLFVVFVAVIVVMVFSSASLVMGALAAAIMLLLVFVRPTWALALLLLYLPFEPFLLKWIPDGIYLYARYASELMVYLLAASALWKRMIGREGWQSTALDIPFIVFLLTILASIVVNVLPVTDAILGTRQIVRFILLYFVAVSLAPSVAWVKRVLIGLFCILGIQVLLGYSQAVFGEPVDTFLLPTESRSFGDIQLTSGTVQFWDYGQRIFGTMGRYDRLGTFMAFVLLIILSILYEPSLKKEYTWLFWLFLFSLPALAMTYSRSSWFGFVLGALFIAIWAKKDRRVAIGAGIGIGVMAFYLAVSGLVIDQLLEVPDQNITERFFEAFSYERWRSEYYGLGRLYWIVESVATVIPASPLFGHGPGMYGGGAVAALGNTTVYDMLGLPFGVYGTEGYIDNNWLSLWGEVGTLGLVAFLWIYITLFVSCIRVWMRAKDPFVRAVSIGVAAAMIAMALNAFLATFLEVRTLAAYIWTMGGVVVGLGKKEGILE